MSQPDNIDRLPPHSMEAEQALLGCIFLAPDETIPVCITRIAEDTEVFYDLRHKKIYEILIQMYDEREPIDTVTVMTWMQFQGCLEEIGGISYLSQLPSFTPSAANLPSYLQTVLDHRLSRKLIKLAAETTAAVYDNADDPTALAQVHAQEAMDLTQSLLTEEERPILELVNESIDRIERWTQNPGSLTGIPSGFQDIDRVTTGFQDGDMIVLAARPSMGKTSLAMNMATNVAINFQLPVGVFSLEMTSESLTTRMICSEARVNLRLLQAGHIAQTDFPKLTTAAGRVAHAPIHINDRSGLSILGLRTRARKMHRMHGIKLMVIDYLQLMNSGHRKSGGNRQEEVAEISSGVKALAKELHIPIIVLSQLNRELEKEKNRKPRMSDLRESGAIEQDADIVGFLYKPPSESEDQEEEASVPVNLLIAKQRNGPTADIPLVFIKTWCRFESAAHVSHSDVPSQDEQPPLPEYGEQGQLV